MNDFTKEELEYLKETVMYDIEECHVQHPALEVLDKIESLIDNYCEHKWSNACCGCELARLECSKCETIITELKVIE